MSNNRIGGTIYVKRDGVLLETKGAFTYGLGNPERTTVMRSDGTAAGYTEEGKAPFIEGVVIDRADLDTRDLLELDGETITLELANGKTVALSGAYQIKTHEGKTDEGTFPVRFEGTSADEV